MEVILVAAAAHPEYPCSQKAVRTSRQMPTGANTAQFAEVAKFLQGNN
jgi:hypothetical protein